MSQTPEAIVQRQVDAYNAHDLDAFAGFYAVEAAYVRHGDNSVLFAGRAAIREAYGELFEQHPAVHVEIASRIAQGRFVIDQEHITGREDGAEPRLVAIYEVADDLIQNVWVLR